MVKNFSEDLSTIQLFQVLQATEPGRFGALGTPGNPRYVEDLLRNPSFTKAVKEKISGILGGEKINGDEIVSLQNEVVKLQGMKIDKENAIVENNSKISFLDKELEQYDRQIDTTTGKPVGVYIKQINTLNEDLNQQKAELGHMKNQLDSIDRVSATGKITSTIVVEIGGNLRTLATKVECDGFIRSPEGLVFRKSIIKKEANVATIDGKIKQLEKNEIDNKAELKERKANVDKLSLESENAGKSFTQKEKELKEKEVSVVNKEKELKKSIDEILRDTYGEMFTTINTVAGEWQGEQIKKAEQLVRKRLHGGINDRYTEQRNGKIKIKKDVLKNDIKDMVKSKPGEAVIDFGIGRINELLRSRLTSPAEKEYLKTIVKINPRTNIVEMDPVTHKPMILNEEAFKSLSTELMGEALAVAVAKDPDMLKDVFSKDEVIARMMAGDELPMMMEQAGKENKLRNSTTNLDNVTKPEYKKLFWEWIKDHKKVSIMIAILVALGLFTGAKAMG